MSADTKAATGCFRPIPGFPGYGVDLNGGVWSLSSNWRGYGARMLSPCFDSDGYPMVRLVLKGRRVRKKVHAVVALALLGPKPTPHHEVRHLNGCKIDNHPTNLAWGTRKENASDRDRHGRTARGERNGAHIAARARAALAKAGGGK